MPQKASSVLHTYLINHNENIESLSTRELIIRLFLSNPSKKYKSHDDIISALSEKYGVLRTQSAISKAFKNFLGRPFKVQNKQRIICKHEGVYILLDNAEYTENIRHLLTSKNVFLRNYVYYEHGIRTPHTFIFWLRNPTKQREYVVDHFQKMLEGEYCDIFCYKNKLIVMLNPESNNIELLSDVLKNFFSPYYDAYKVHR